MTVGILEIGKTLLVFEDGVKRALSLRISEKFLKKVGLRNQRSLKRSDEKNLLTRIALKYIPQLAYYYVVDKWRYDVLTGTSRKEFSEHRVF